jgi:hypothetical protein
LFFQGKKQNYRHQNQTKQLVRKIIKTITRFVSKNIIDIRVTTVDKEV